MIRRLISYKKTPEKFYKKLKFYPLLKNARNKEDNNDKLKKTSLILKRPEIARKLETREFMNHFEVM